MLFDVSTKSGHRRELGDASTQKGGYIFTKKKTMLAGPAFQFYAASHILVVAFQAPLAATQSASVFAFATSPAKRPPAEVDRGDCFTSGPRGQVSR